MKPRLLLHVCCAPCSTHVIEELSKDYSLTLFFYNPNIHPIEEHEKRLAEAKRFAKQLGLMLIPAKYSITKWLDAVNGLEKEKEGGKRCGICFAIRLEETAKIAEENNFDLFTTTLTVSPYKNAALINNIGKELEKRYEIKFLAADFKKHDGYKKSMELSKKYKLYRQNYCGCIFSKQS